MCTTRQTLIEIYHPTFRRSYQDGRQYYFREQIILTDKHLVEYLRSIFEEEEAETGDESLFYATGYLVGQMSGSVIPRQPHEDNTGEMQEAFLVKVRQKYGAAGEAITDTMQQLWAIQDQLAQTLDADIFSQMMKRGGEEGNC